MRQNTYDWLSNKVPGFRGLRMEERVLISEFVMLWSYFEGTILNANCNVPSIRQYADTLEAQNQIPQNATDDYLYYLKQRYFSNGSFTAHFDKLYLDRSGNPPEVFNALRDNNAAEKTKFTGCLIIVYRLRNNLFHGEKWQYELRGQSDNFLHANDFLKEVMQ